jgi:hypothetical protein
MLKRSAPTLCRFAIQLEQMMQCRTFTEIRSSQRCAACCSRGTSLSAASSGCRDGHERRRVVRDDLGLEPVGNTPAEFTAIIKKETPEWAKVIKDAGIKFGNWLGLPGLTLWKIVGASQFVRLPGRGQNGLFRRAVPGTKLPIRDVFAKVAIGGSPDMTRAASREWHF